LPDINTITFLISPDILYLTIVGSPCRILALPGAVPETAPPFDGRSGRPKTSFKLFPSVGPYISYTKVVTGFYRKTRSCPAGLLKKSPHFAMLR